METQVIFRNEECISTEEVLNRFKQELEQVQTYSEDEKEQLVNAFYKDPSDRFIIHAVPDVEGCQGDIMICAQGTPMYEKEIKNVRRLKKTDRLVLQDGDSMTGDHRICVLPGTKLKVEEGEFTPSFLKGKNQWGDRSYSMRLVESDKPILIFHREHGNVCLPAWTYMIFSQMDPETLDKMLD